MRPLLTDDEVAQARADVCRVAEVLTDPAFAALEQWLRQRQVPVDQLQAALDKYLDMARQTALDASAEPQS